MGDFRASCLLTSKRGTSGSRSTTMYRENSGPQVNVPCIDGGPQGLWSISMYRGTSGPKVNVQCIDVGDLMVISTRN